MMQLRVEEEHRQAASRRIKQLVVTDRTGWLLRQRNRALSRLGGFLASSGQQLLQFVSQLPSGIEGSASRAA